VSGINRRRSLSSDLHAGVHLLLYVPTARIHVMHTHHCFCSASQGVKVPKCFRNKWEETLCDNDDGKNAFASWWVQHGVLSMMRVMAVKKEVPKGMHPQSMTAASSSTWNKRPDGEWEG